MHEARTIMFSDSPLARTLGSTTDLVLPSLPLLQSSMYSDQPIGWIRDVARLVQSAVLQFFLFAVVLLWTIGHTVPRFWSGATVPRQEAPRIRLRFEICSQAARASALAFLSIATAQSSGQWPNVLNLGLAFLLGLGRLFADAKWRRIALHQVNVLLVATLALLLASDFLPLLEMGHDRQVSRALAGALGSLTAAVLIAFVTPREWLPPTPAKQTPFKLPEAKPSPEETCSWFVAVVSFQWLSQLVWKGWRAPVELHDLPSLPWYDEPLWVLSNLMKARSRYRKSLWTILSFQRTEILTMCAWIALAFSVELVGPLAMYQLLEYLAAPNDAGLHPSIWVFLLFAGPMARTVAFQQYVFTSTRLVVRIRSGLTQELFHRAMSSLEPEDDVINKVSAKDDVGKKQSTTTKAGRMANLMASDTESIIRARDIVQVGIGVPIGIVITVIGLYRIVGWTSLVGISFLVLTAPLPAWLARKMNHSQRKIKLVQDSRISLISEYLKSIKAIKYLAWEDPVVERIHEARSKELKEIWWLIVLNILIGQLAAIIPVITLLMIFGLYVAVVREPLTASIAFTTSVLTLTLKRNLGLVTFMTRNATEALVSLERLDRYFSTTDPLIRFPVGPLDIRGATFRRSKKETSFRLRNITIDFIDGGLNIISGKSGSGKTSLLLSILGELALEAGAVTCPSNIAFASQTPWLQNMTIRDNIVFNSPFERHRYESVLEACRLPLDLDELPSRDQTKVGEDGTALSGGQKSRVALARALYSKAPLLLLDDIFSTLDTKTTAAVWKLCFCSDMLKGRTVVLVTQVPWMAPQADLAITMEDGLVKSKEQNLGAVRRPVRPESVRGVVEGSSSSGDAIKASVADAKPLQSTDKCNDIVSEMEASRESTRFTIFRYMLYFGGILPLSIALLLTVLVNTLGLATTYWLSIWVGAYEKGGNVDVAFYAGIYALIINALAVTEGITGAVYQRGAWFAGLRLHQAMTRAVVGAPLSWWKDVPVGRVINRFSQDIKSLDLALGRMVSASLDMLVRIFFRLGAVSSILPIFMLPALGTVAIGVVFGEMYTRTAVTVRRLLSASRSPVFTHFGDTMNGLAVIRARSGMPETFCHQLAEKIRPYARSEEATYNLNRWVAIRIDFVTALVMMSAGAIAIWKADVLGAGQVGFSLANATGLSSVILNLVRNMNDLEVELQSFHRIEEYVKIQPEEKVAEAEYQIDEGHVVRGDDSLTNDWPRTGSVEFRNVTIRYDPQGPDILKDVNLTFAAGERVAIVGRTGSGKSTLVSSLLRFTHIVTGQILYDGVDITRVTRKRLRQAVTIIPQDAVLFNGTVQTNLDPSATVPAEVLEKTLRSCSGIASFQYSRSDEAQSDSHLSGENGTVTSAVGAEEEHAPPPSHAGGDVGKGVHNGTVGTTSRTTMAGKLSLTTNVEPNGENFSHGQRQLLSLCRALIRKSKLMLLDEATASMDYETDSSVQAVLREELRDSTKKDRAKPRTLVTIAHRLRTIIDYDQVVVMGGGRVLEIGTPRELYARGGQFTELVRHSGEGAELVDILEGSQP